MGGVAESERMGGRWGVFDSVEWAMIAIHFLVSRVDVRREKEQREICFFLVFDLRRIDIYSAFNRQDQTHQGYDNCAAVSFRCDTIWIGLLGLVPFSTETRKKRMAHTKKK